MPVVSIYYLHSYKMEFIVMVLEYIVSGLC
jgi:hypothetical protein